MRQRRGRAQKAHRDAKQNQSDRFLYDRIVGDTAERILDVNRSFPHVLLLGDTDLTRALANLLGDKFGFCVFADHSHYSGANVSCEVICDEEHLPFRAGSFDLVVNLLSLHGVNHVPQVLAQFKTLLKPDGLMMCCAFGGQTLSALRSVFYEAEDMLYGRVSPRISSMIRLDQATALLQGAGYTLPVTDRDLVRVSYRALHTLYQDLRAMGETNVLTARAPFPVSRRFFELVELIYKRDQSNEAGKFIAQFEILWLTGWAPHPSQQKPLKPGSAKTSLADALGVSETKL